MQLRKARLCLDCEEVHDAQQCPLCTSESFAFLTRWIPARERRTVARVTTNDPTVDHERLEAVSRLTKGRVLTGGFVGLTALSVMGWMWRRGGKGQTLELADRREADAGRDDVIRGLR
jgi:hypothetical protein